ncbi:MAG: OB-fold nucleic acid binding domain-containing protein [Candidatus Atribacteria bacterium]|nr:OB-fold nucleic acid binding domain-containing protein [Candidatus Atribacteria bacterium]
MLRTHNCGALRIPDEGKEVCLTGWANRRRNHGGVIFIDLRDRWGITQLVIGSTNEAVYDTANAVKSEYVLQVKGIVRARPEGLINPKIPTGEIELQVLSLTILSEAKLLRPSSISSIVQTNPDDFRFRSLFSNCPVLPG